MFFSDQQITEIDQTLAKYLEMATPHRETLINDLIETGTWRQAAYGSLIAAPSSVQDDHYRGTIHGWERGTFCLDAHYRGTPRKTTVTLAALPAHTPDVKMNCLVLEIAKHDQENASDFFARIIDNIKAFASRETALCPVYKFEAIEVETEHHEMVKAVICAADPDGPLYIGRDNEILSLDEKAMITATSIGIMDDTNISPRKTGMAYWRFIIMCDRIACLETEPHIREFVELCEFYRAAIDTRTREELEKIESDRDFDYHLPVYDIDATHAPSPQEIDILLQAAGQKIGWGTDPIPPERRAYLKELFGL